MEFRKDIFDLKIFNLKRFKDKRGMLTKFFYSDLFDKYNFKVDDIYTTVSHKNVVRGLHHQLSPYGQAKLITCLSGNFWDISVDLRKGSSTYGKVFSYKLSSKKDESILIPAGFSHGTISLDDGTVMLSICSGKYLPETEGGININSLNLEFLKEKQNMSLILSSKDESLPNIEEVL